MGLRSFKKKTTFYFIGICGISMSALAKYVKFCGHEVNGSDLYGGEQAEKLRFLGMQVFVGAEPYLPFVETADVVVYTDAIPVENKELLHARKCGKKLYSRVEFLREICLDFSRVIAVAGSHGKTTCTAMCAHVLQAANVPFCAHIGGEDSVMENFRFCGNEYFVTEACEYKKNLLKIPADTAILLNVDKDHLECYAGEEDLQNTFYSFCGAAKTSVVCMDDMAASKVEHAVTFSLYEKTADYRAAYLRNDKQKIGRAHV